MTNIYIFDKYQAFFKAYLEKQPKKGHGLLSQWAQALKVSTTLISQIISGKKSLNLEIAMGFAQILELNQNEMDYLFLLVEWERAGTPQLKSHFKKKIEVAQKASRQLKNRIEDVEELSSEVKAHYYASWVYSAVRNLIATDSRLDADNIAKRLKISRTGALEAVEFMQRYGLIVPEKNGWSIGPKDIYLSSDSPLVNKHHQNWRLKSVQSMDDKNEESLYFSSPMSLSHAAAKELRKHIVDLIQDVRKVAGPSPSETVRCLNIDWFEY